MGECKKCGGFIFDHKKHSCNLWYFKHEYFGDDWQDKWSERWDAEDVAREIAQMIYSDDPCDPYNFHVVVEIKDTQNNERKFKIYAEADVNFYANEV